MTDSNSKNKISLQLSSVFNTTFNAKAGDKMEVVLSDKQGQPLHRISASLIDTKLAKSYSGYYDIEHDLEDAIGALAKLLQIQSDGDSTLCRSLLTSAIITYGRCFTQADGRGTKLENKHPWIHNSDDEFKLHNELMGMRNQLYAHAGNNLFRKVETMIILDSKESPKTVQLFCLKWDLQGFEADEIIKIIQHFEKVKMRVSEKLTDIGTRLEKLAFEKLINKIT